LICAVHASVGAAVGRLTGKRAGSFWSGVATHLICDLLPHKDFDPKVEAPLLAATLGVIAIRCGVTSPEMAGAVGAITPDFENAAFVTGLVPKSAMKFPTHIGDGANHGPVTKSAWPQGILAAVCLLFVLWPRGDKSA
jgi:hypothetical protein